MIMPDANLLIYAVNKDAPQHQAAKNWWEDTLSDNKIVGIPWVVSLAFLRITTNSRVFSTPLQPTQAIAYLDEWLAQPVCRLVSPGDHHWSILRNLLIKSGIAGNLTTDAHIAALAIEQGYTVYSCDYDFQRFSGLQHINPIANNARTIHEPRPSYG